MIGGSDEASIDEASKVRRRLRSLGSAQPKLLSNEFDLKQVFLFPAGVLSRDSPSVESSHQDWQPNSHNVPVTKSVSIHQTCAPNGRDAYQLHPLRRPCS